MRKTYYLIDGTVLSGEVVASYAGTVEVIDDAGNLWSLTQRNIVRICTGKAYADGGVNYDHNEMGQNCTIAETM